MILANDLCQSSVRPLVKLLSGSPALLDGKSNVRVSNFLAALFDSFVITDFNSQTENVDGLNCEC